MFNSFRACKAHAILILHKKEVFLKKLYKHKATDQWKKNLLMVKNQREWTRGEKKAITDGENFVVKEIIFSCRINERCEFTSLRFYFCTLFFMFFTSLITPLLHMFGRWSITINVLCMMFCETAINRCKIYYMSYISLIG